MKKTVKKAYGKINLILRVGEKRADGRHEVLTVMTKVGAYDTVTVSAADEKGIFINCSDKSLMTEENLAYKAAECYFKTAGVTPSVKISIEKNIPVTAGMAGGSTDAGATLTALNEIYAALSFEELYNIAASLGADVPFFIYDDKTMLGRGTGTELSPFPSLPEGLYGLFVIGMAEKESTGRMYALLDEAKSGAVTVLLGAESKLREKIEGGDTLGAIDAFCNDFELCNKHITEIEAMLKKHGARRALLCGSGPTVCGIFTDRKSAESARRAISYKSFVSEL